MTAATREVDGRERCPVCNELMSIHVPGVDRCLGYLHDGIRRLKEMCLAMPPTPRAEIGDP